MGDAAAAMVLAARLAPDSAPCPLSGMVKKQPVRLHPHTLARAQTGCCTVPAHDNPHGDIENTAGGFASPRRWPVVAQVSRCQGRDALSVAR